MRPVIFPRDGPSGLTRAQVLAMMPEVGEIRTELPSVIDGSNRLGPKRCIVVEIHPDHLWYRVRFIDSGNHECYKVPRLKFMPTGGVPW